MFNFEAITLFKYTNYAVNKNLEEISDEEAVKIPENGINSVNWILGHIVLNRDSALETAGLEKLCGEKFKELYDSGKSPAGLPDTVKTDELIKLFNKSQEMLMKKFEEVDFSSDKKKTELFIGLGFHEAYHAGQIAVIRKLLGKTGKIK